MLKTLRVRHVALIEELDMELYDGFSVLTGETGAGKSIIIEALNFVLGERASRELIMTGKQKASVEAVFRLSPGEPVYTALEACEIEPEDGELSLYREMSVSGKNVCRIDGAPVSAAMLKEVGDLLVDIHGQHAHQSLLNPKLHLLLTDAFAGEPAARAKARVLEAFRAQKDAYTRLHASEMNERDRERRCDLLRYQIQEIDAAALLPGEEEQLLEQRRILQNSQTIMESLEGAAEGLSGDAGGLAALSQTLHALEAIRGYHKDYADAADRLREAYYTVEDVALTVRDLRSGFSFEPDALDRLEWRLETIAQLRRKYGADVGEILAYRERIGAELEELTSFEERRETLQQALDAAQTQYLALAAELTALRRAAGRTLEERLLPELAALGMPDAAFTVAISEAPDSGTGVDAVEFLLSTNKGEPVKPLTRVASGGEVSRIMLAFKSVFAASDGIPTMVFDEIDTGISGGVGTAVAVKMRAIAERRQVLAITHLPQIAAYAEHHYLVKKETVGGVTRSGAALLDLPERVAEVARIMSGTPDDPVARQHARNMIDTAAGR